MKPTKENMITGRKVIIKKALKYAKENNEDFIDYLNDTIEDMRDMKQSIPKGLRRMVRLLTKKAILLTKATFEQKLWSIRYFRDMEMYDTDFEELLLNQMLVKNEYIHDPTWTPKLQEWELEKARIVAEGNMEVRVDKVKAVDHSLDKPYIITDRKMKRVKEQRG